MIIHFSFRYFCRIIQHECRALCVYLSFVATVVAVVVVAIVFFFFPPIDPYSSTKHKRGMPKRDSLILLGFSRHIEFFTKCKHEISRILLFYFVFVFCSKGETRLLTFLFMNFFFVHRRNFLFGMSDVL